MCATQSDILKPCKQSSVGGKQRLPDSEHNITGKRHMLWLAFIHIGILDQGCRCYGHDVHQRYNIYAQD